MTVRETIARNFKSYRHAVDATQAQVASRLGIWREAVAEIEAGRRRAKAEELMEAADMFGISFEDLCTAAGAPNCPGCGRPYVPKVDP